MSVNQWLRSVADRAGFPVPARAIMRGAYRAELPALVHVRHRVTLPLASAAEVDLTGTWASPELADLGVSGAQPDVLLAYLGWRAVALATPYTVGPGSGGSGRPSDAVRAAVASAYIAHQPQGSQGVRYEAVTDILQQPAAPALAAGLAGEAPGELTMVVEGGELRHQEYRVPLRGPVPVYYRDDRWVLVQTEDWSAMPGTGSITVVVEALALAVRGSDARTRPSLLEGCGPHGATDGPAAVEAAIGLRRLLGR